MKKYENCSSIRTFSSSSSEKVVCIIDTCILPTTTEKKEIIDLLVFVVYVVFIKLMMLSTISEGLRGMEISVTLPETTSLRSRHSTSASSTIEVTEKCAAIPVPAVVKNGNAAESPFLFRVATLNCWALPQPWPIGSKDRAFRINALIDDLQRNDFDVVCLQELWSDNDFFDISEQLSTKFPYRHYFHSGYTGSGTCILSKWKILSTLIHRYTLNGFPHHVHRGDWFGGKVVGLAELDVGGRRICVYTTHLHAEYNRDNDLYLPHRLCQAFELAQFVHHTSRDADFLILAGDFNLEPDDLGMYVIKNMANVKDAWLESAMAGKPSGCTGMTCDRPDNCYTNKSLLTTNPIGKRLDYILYQAVKREAKLVECENCFDAIGESGINFSDHLGVRAVFRLGNGEHTPPPRCVNRDCLHRMQAILNEGEKRIVWDRRFFAVLAALMFLLFFVIGRFTDLFPFVGLAIGIAQAVIIFVLAFCVWHGIVFLTTERRAVAETKWTVNNILSVDSVIRPEV